MATRSLARDALWLALRFLVLVPICLYVWWQILPAYAWVLGKAASVVLIHLFDVPITDMDVVPKGLAKTNTELIYWLGDAQRVIHIAMLVTNVAPFVALVLATPKLTWRRRGYALLWGCLVLAAAHMVFLITAYKVSRAEVPQAFGQLCVTLPFPLWIAFAYWERIMSFLGYAKDSEGEPASD